MNMKILFINPPFLSSFSRSQRSPGVTKGGTIYYPYWLGYAAGLAEKNGFEIKLMDCAVKDVPLRSTIDEIERYSPSLIVVDSSTPSIYNDVEFADNLKRSLPSSYILLVGTHPSALPEETLKISGGGVDAIAIGEYDVTVSELAQTISGKRDPNDIAGLYTRKGFTPARKHLEDLDILPFISSIYKRFLDINDYYFAASDHPMVMMITGRGCPYGCFFCVYPQTMHGKKYRQRSARNVVDEFKYVRKELPRVREIVIEDDTFTVDTKRVREICRLLIEENVRMKWSCNVRVNLDLETMRLMKKAGCRLLIVGYESGSQKVLDGMKKKIRLEESRSFAENARKAGLLVHGCFMVGNPGETKETMRQTFDFAVELDCDSAQFYPLYIYPGTEAYEWAKNECMIKKDVTYRDWLTASGKHNAILDMPGISAREMIEFCDKAYLRFHLRPRYILKKLVQLFTSPSEGIRSLRSALNFIAGSIHGK